MSQEEDEYWAEEIANARRTQLDTVKKAAAGWTALFSAVLAVFGSVTFASGLTGLDDLASTTKAVVRVGIAVAAGATLLATLLAGAVTARVPNVSNVLTVDAFREDRKSQAERGLRLLKVSIFFGVVAAIAVTAGSLTVLFADRASAPSTPSAVVAVVDGKAVCGPPEKKPGSVLVVDGVQLNGATSIVPVASCPK